MAKVKKYSYVREAYIRMAEEVRYRPAAPSDGFGGGCLSEQQLADSNILEEEADGYALKFLAQEDTARFLIGVSDLSTSRALVYVIEAARCLCSAWTATREVRSQMLLGLAIDELHDLDQTRAEDKT